MFVWKIPYLVNIDSIQFIIFQVFSTFINSFLCELLCSDESNNEEKEKCDERYCKTRE